MKRKKYLGMSLAVSPVIAVISFGIYEHGSKIIPAFVAGIVLTIICWVGVTLWIDTM